MKYKKSLVFICLVICLFSIASTVASDLNETIVANEYQSVEIVSVENDELISEDNNDDELSASTGTFTDLANEIANVTTELNLTKDYIYSDIDSNYINGVNINKKIIINGNGYVINGNNQARAFVVSYNCVVLKNISFVNCSAYGYGGAIYWSGNDGDLYKCSFVNCSAPGGAIFWQGLNGVLSNCSFANSSTNWRGSNGVLDNCSFANSSTRWDGSNGVLDNCSFVNSSTDWFGSNGVLSNCSFVNCSKGAIYWQGSNGVLDNCSFVNCSSNSFESGIVSWNSFNGTISGCSFVNCSTYQTGGAVFWKGSDGVLSNCIFVNCSSSIYGGSAIYWYDLNGTVSGCSFVNCSNGTIYWRSARGTVSGCSFVNCSANYDGGAVYWGYSDGVLCNCSFVNCLSSQSGGAIYWYGDKGTVSGCSFVDCSAGYGGTIYWFGSNGVLGNCSLVNCSADYGGAIFWGSARGTVSGCSFINCSANQEIGATINWEGNYGVLSNCSFVNCSSSSYGGAIYWCNNYGSLSNCSFMDCSADYDGGAIYWYGDRGTVSGCSFVDCSADYDGGAIYWNGNYGSLSNCSFMDCSADYDGGAIYWYGTNGYVIDSIFNKYADDIYWKGDNGQLIGCNYKRLISNGKCKVLHKSFINITCDNNIYFNEVVTINTTCVLGATGIVKLYVDNIFKRSLHIGETFNLSDLNAGKHIVKVIYNGDNSFIGSECSVNITVFKINTEIQVSPINLVYDNTIINITLNNKTTGTVTININNKNYSSTINKGKSTIYINNLDVKEYDYTVWYNGDQNFNKNQINGTLKTERKETSINISSNDIFIGEPLVIYYNITEGTNGSLNIYIDDNYKQSVSIGQKIKLDNLMSGNYTIKVVYAGDNYHFSCENILNVSVKKYSSNFNFDVEDVYVGDSVYIDYAIVNNATGDLTVYIDNVPVKIVSVGKNIELSTLNVGEHTLKVVYSGNDYYDSCEQITTFNVEKYDSHFYFDNSIPGKNVIIDLVFDEDVTGYVNITFGEFTFYNKKLINGKTNFVIYNLVADEYEYVVNYTGDEKYKPLSEHDCNYVYPNDSPIILNIPELNWGDLFIINPTLPKDATGDIELLFDNVSLCNMSVGKNYSYNLFNGGKHDLTVRYSGDKYFVENETTFNLNINRINSTLCINETVYANPSSLIVINLNEEINGFITVIINNEKYSGKVTNGKYSFNVNNFNIGSNNVIIDYVGDNKYNPIYTIKEINVLLKDAKLDFDICNIVSGDDLVIKPNIVSEATGTFKIFVDDILNTTIDVGTTYYLYPQSLGKHEIKIVYSGDDYFESKIFTSVFRVFAKYPIESNDMQIIYGSNNHFQAIFYDEYGDLLTNKYIIFKVNGEDISARTDSNGVASLNIELDIGEYNITIINPTANENTTNKVLIFTSIESEEVYTINNTDFEFNVTFLDGSAEPLQNTPVIFKLNGEDKVVTTNAKGIATLKLNLDIGIYDIILINTVTDESKINKVYVKSSSTGKYTHEIDDKDIVIPVLPSSSTESIIVKLPSDASGTITLNINGENYGFDVVNGVANVVVPELTNGVYSYSITYSGDSKYSSFTKTGKVTVNKTAPKHVPKPPAKTTLTLKKVKVKRSAKKLVITATLKVNGKAVKGKTIKFKFNKKTYKAKTNKKGIAKITVKKSVLKKLKAGKKVKYQATYGKITKKVTVKVKK